MACYHPIDAHRTPSGEVTFNPFEGVVGRSFKISCGQCHGCRLERSRQWAVRITHEASLHTRTHARHPEASNRNGNCFATLTYSDDELPDRGTLVLEHLQKFMKRVRRHFPQTIRFYQCGEYGDHTQRPHYHSCLFNVDFSEDRKHHKTTPAGDHLYTSVLLDELWTHGHCILGELTFDSAAYVARYVMKKRTGKQAPLHYERFSLATGEVYEIKPEFATMSRRPGIGKTWLDKYGKTDCFNHDQVAINGHTARPPRYYDNQLDDVSLLALKAKRAKEGRLHRANNTPDRLAVREACALSKATPRM